MTTLPTTSGPPNCQPDCEGAINDHISLELYASNMYESLASYFNSNDVTLRHLVQFFLQQANMEREHAKNLIQLQNQRGGHIHLQNIICPDHNCWENSLVALDCAFNLKMRVNQSLFDLYHLATKKDNNLRFFLKSSYRLEEMKFITELMGHINNLRKMVALQSGLAEDFSAKLTLEDSDKKN